MTITPAGFQPASELIRALRQPEEGDDEAAWTARWATLLEEVTIEDAEAAVADLLVQLAHIDDTLTMYRRKPDQRFNVSRTHMINFRALRDAQLKYLRQWLYTVRQDEERELKALERAERRKIELARTKTRLQITQAKSHNHQLAMANAKTVAEVRAYKRAVYEREHAIALERIGFVREHVPDGSEPVLMVQAMRQVVVSLKAKLLQAGIDPPLDEHEQTLLAALIHWLETNAGLQAMDEVDSRTQ